MSRAASYNGRSTYRPSQRVSNPPVSVALRSHVYGKCMTSSICKRFHLGFEHSLILIARIFLVASMVHIDPLSLSISGSERITGTISLALPNSYFFPGRNWDDFVVVLLGGWLSILNNLKSGVRTSDSLYFMDGPYEVELFNERPGMLMCRGIRQRMDSNETTFEATVEFSTLYTDVRNAGIEIYKACEERGWRNSDLDFLRSLCFPGPR